MYVLTMEPVICKTINDVMDVVCRNRACLDCPLFYESRCLSIVYSKTKKKTDRAKVEQQIISAINASPYGLKIMEE